jgi:hypothetical protein
MLHAVRVEGMLVDVLQVLNGQRVDAAWVLLAVGYHDDCAPCCWQALRSEAFV